MNFWFQFSPITPTDIIQILAIFTAILVPIYIHFHMLKRSQNESRDRLVGELINLCYSSVGKAYLVVMYVSSNKFYFYEWYGIHWYIYKSLVVLFSGTKKCSSMLMDLHTALCEIGRLEAKFPLGMIISDCEHELLHIHNLELELLSSLTNIMLPPVSFQSENEELN